MALTCPFLLLLPIMMVLIKGHVDMFPNRLAVCIPEIAAAFLFIYLIGGGMTTGRGYVFVVYCSWLKGMRSHAIAAL